MMLDRYGHALDIWKAKCAELLEKEPHQVKAISRCEQQIAWIERELNDFYRRDEERL